MQQPSRLDTIPAARVAELRGLIGREKVAAWCVDLLAGRAGPTDADNPPLTWLGGKSTAWLLGLEGEQAEVNAYWVRVWGARGLLHCYDDLAARDVVAALRDEAWRVREMAAKVVGRWEVGEAAEALEPLLSDDVPRVRTAAARALGAVGEAEQAERLRELEDDPEPAVRAAAEVALTRLRARLDRDL